MGMTREEVIENLEILKEDYWDDDGYGHETKQYDDTMLALDMAIKALEQEPKTGHWIWNDEKTYCKCSECGIGMGHTEYDFCPNCGVKMVEPQESEVEDGNDDK